MTPVAEILLFVLPGYAFLFTFTLGRYVLLRRTGYEMILITAIAGFLIQLPTNALLWFISAGSPHFTVSDQGHIVWSLLVAFGFAWLGNVVVDQVTEGGTEALGAALVGDLVERQLLLAFESSKGTAELTMKNGKVYVGYPLATGVGTLAEADVTIIPVMSGFRNETTKHVHTTVLYGNVLAEAEDIGEFAVALPKAEIASARQFDMDIYVDRFDSGSVVPKPTIPASAGLLAKQP